jgi:hypothetical protein
VSVGDLLCLNFFDGVFRKIAIALHQFVSCLDILEIVGGIFALELIELVSECFNLPSDAVGGSAKGMQCFLRARGCK